jgi:hypothetical protein
VTISNNITPVVKWVASAYVCAPAKKHYAEGVSHMSHNSVSILIRAQQDHISHTPYKMPHELAALSILNTN